MINKLKVKCHFHSFGCEWIGKLEERSSHFANDCLFITSQCQLNGCGVLLMRMELEQHESACKHGVSTCTHCGKNFTLPEIRVHYTKCPMMEIECPNGCGVSFKRNDLNHHLENDCEEEFYTFQGKNKV